MQAPAQSPSSAEGFVLIEILVSALVLAIAAAAIFSLLNTTAHSAADERNRSEAYAIAQEDQARLRSMRISELNRLNQNRPVTVNGTTFTVNSTGTFVNDTTTSTSCKSGAASADYVKVASSVTWTNMGATPAVGIQSIVSPANGSLDPSHGTLTVSVANAAGTAIPGIGLTGTGAGTFNGTTDSSGCAMFPDQPSGNYTLTVSGVAAGLVDKDGKTPAPFTVGVIPGGTNPVFLLYDRPGSIGEVAFETKYANGEVAPSTADSMIVFNTGMTSAKLIGTPGGTRQTTLAAPSLFPFASADSVYAGSCTGNNPNPTGETNPPGAAAMASVLVPANGVAPKATLRLPALYVTVRTGKNSSSPGSLFNNADVWIRDDKCSSESVPVTRRYATNSSGTLNDPGLPWSTYDVCVDSQVGGGSSRRERIPNVSVENLATGPSLTFYLGEGSGSVSESGPCP
jgi:Tfp pilus assembly protein PilV